MTTQQTGIILAAIDRENKFIYEIPIPDIAIG
jgi:hypothetical protein